ncbi:2TM domain-containing protein [Aquimarina megaterium]|uniref:2TM domain-containing protein n=1 Tax=Aquimarina megaterium TaxID=1443666 RepID=UPI000471D991|nr:2TM domain-containing protein [Aquimarina megaterium]
MKDFERQNIFNLAKIKVQKEKRFYYHLSIFVVVNIALLFLKGEYLVFSSTVTTENQEIIKSWFDRIMLIIPVLWGIILLLHGLLILGESLLLGKNDD